MDYYKAFCRLLFVIGLLVTFKFNLPWGAILMGYGIVGGW